MPAELPWWRSGRSSGRLLVPLGVGRAIELSVQDHSGPMWSGMARS